MGKTNSLGKRTFLCNFPVNDYIEPLLGGSHVGSYFHSSVGTGQGLFICGVSVSGVLDGVMVELRRVVRRQGPELTDFRVGVLGQWECLRGFLSWPLSESSQCSS